MKFGFSTLVLSLGIGLLTGCGSDNGGGNGGNNEAPFDGTLLFQNDMQQLKITPMNSAKATDDRMNGAISKVFGGTTNQDVYQFISERVKYVYERNQAKNFQLSVYKNGRITQIGLFSHLWAKSKDEGSYRTAATNYGSALAWWEQFEDVDIQVQLPEGTVDAGSYRLGLVVLTKYYFNGTYKDGGSFTKPVETRIATLAHEGRHSDCPNGPNATDCGFRHRICTLGPAAGVAGCDNGSWGPYAVGALYLKSTLNNYHIDSPEYHMIQTSADDSLSRLTTEQKEALYNTEPELNSF